MEGSSLHSPQKQRSKSTHVEQQRGISAQQLQQSLHFISESKAEALLVEMSSTPERKRTILATFAHTTSAIASIFAYCRLRLQHSDAVC